MMMTACEKEQYDPDRLVSEKAERFAEAYFNFDYQEAIEHVDSASVKWINFAASNVTQSDIDHVVLDVHRDDNPHLGHFKRCFSTDVDVITRNAGWIIDAHHNRGVLCATKHFPGQGNATGDSHYELVDVTNTWQQRELEPYKRLIAQGKIDVVLTAHIYNRQLDDQYPATLSHKTIDGVLRKQLGFDGVVITDDMYMQGILDQHSVPEAFALAINAGADLLLVGNNIDTGFEAERPFYLVDMIVDLVKSGKVPYSRIHESSERILKLKAKIAK